MAGNLFCFLAAAVLCSILGQGHCGNLTFCYFSESAQWRPSFAAFKTWDIDPHLCTHVIIAFVNVKNNRFVFPRDDWNQKYQRMMNVYDSVNILKQANPDIKVMIAVGGWNANYNPFIDVMGPGLAGKQEFAQDAIGFMRHYNLDGLDMNWEFPGTRGSPDVNQAHYTLLLKTFRDEINKEANETGLPSLILTQATAVSNYYIPRAYETTEIHKYLDYLLLLTYNYHGGWDRKAGHHSTIDHGPYDVGANAELCQSWAVNFWLEAGAPPEKLVLGLATYGMSMTLTSRLDSNLNAPIIGGGSPGMYTRQRGILAYYEICDDINKFGWDYRWLDVIQAPIATNNDTWVGFDNSRSLRLKVEELVKKKDLAGIFVWSLDLDDFSGHCGEGKYPLLRAINEALNAP